MPILTWKNIAAPDTRVALEGIRTAGDFLNRAIGLSRDAVDIYDKAQTEVADQAILNRMLATQDPEEYARRMAAGEIIGPDAANASQDLLLLADARQDALLKRQDALYDSNRKRAIDAEKDALARRLGPAAAQALSGDRRALEAINNVQHFESAIEGGRFLAGLLPTPTDNTQARSAARQQRLQTLGNQIANKWRRWGGDAVTARSFVDSFKASEEDLALGITDDDIQMAGITAIEKLAPGTFSQQFSPNATMGVESRLDNVIPQTYRSNDPYNMVFGGSQFLDRSKEPPLTSLTIGEIVNDTQPRLGKAAEAHPKWGEYSTPVGAYQFNQDTLKRLASTYLGKGWETVVFTPEIQDFLASKLFEEIQANPKAVPSKIWAALKKYEIFTKPGSFQGLTFEQVKPLLIYEETGQLPSNHSNEIQMMEKDIKEIPRSFTEADRVAAGAQEYALKSIGDMAIDLAKQLGAKDKEGDFAEIIRNTVDKYSNTEFRPTPAEVAAALKDSIRSETLGRLDDFKDGLDLFEERFESIVKDLPAARDKIRFYEEFKKNYEDAKELQNLYKERKEYVDSQLKLLKAGNPWALRTALTGLRDLGEISNYIGSTISQGMRPPTTIPQTRDVAGTPPSEEPLMSVMPEELPPRPAGGGLSILF